MKEARLPLSECPHCHYKMDCATCVDKPEELPKPDDVTICLKCGEVLVFTENMGLRLPTLYEYEKYGTDPRIIGAQIVVRGFAGRPDHLKWPQ
jgi:hypothetical protein